jgi:hypothetical protein
MNNLCNFIINSIQYEYDITYYIKQSQQDLISYNYNDNFETVEYICDSIHDYFNSYNYDIIIDYNEPLITFIYNNHKCEITIKKFFDDSLYWILSIYYIK